MEETDFTIDTFDIAISAAEKCEKQEKTEEEGD